MPAKNKLVLVESEMKIKGHFLNNLIETTYNFKADKCLLDSTRFHSEGIHSKTNKDL